MDRPLFHRVWVGPELRATSMAPVGDKDIPEIRVRASDHIGLLVTLAELTT